jgi:formate dehydrogenase subunit gamma
MRGSDAPTATEPSALVPRFNGAERSLHWLLAFTFLTMLATGLILELPTFAELAANRQLWKSIHLGAALGFWVGLFLLVASAHEEIVPTFDQLDRFDEDDRRWLRWAVVRDGDEPAQGRFNAGQKLNSALIAGLLVVLTLSGTVMFLGEVNAGFRGTAAILVHDLATWISIPLIAGHLYLALLHPSTRPSLRGMVRGSVRRDWARRHHPKWEKTL